ncbi:restriction endonuclease subunit S [Phocaeicola sartorii]|uniref:restriction endonuclease subunit S n=1 Tax=Phocaeicola sartorii TaxID=671267 RepID=UPI00248C32F6|nr:restriction endonuclease subunit S [Phocaeicola sartorii]
MSNINTLELDNQIWKEFFLEDVVTINSGKRLTKADMKLGKMPFIGASEANNGITIFTSSKNESLDSNVLGVNYNGSVGFSFYHPYKALFSDDVKRVKWIDNSHNNRYTLLFLSSIIKQQKDKYAYGYKFNAQRMKRQKILLPVTQNDTLDWTFMEAYMKQKEQQILKPTIDKLCKLLIINNITGKGKLSHSQWKAFYFTEVFTEIQRGKRLKKADHAEGESPYVSSTSLNNGVDGFIGNESGVRIFSDCITVANSGSVGSAFFHRYAFVASDHVTQLKREGLDKYAYLFMLPLISRLSEKYSFNREINDERIKREKLLLPVDDNGEIDFTFMSSFMKDVERDILDTTLKMFNGKINVNKSKLWGGGKMERI